MQIPSFLQEQICIFNPMKHTTLRGMCTVRIFVYKRSFSISICRQKRHHKKVVLFTSVIRYLKIPMSLYLKICVVTLVTKLFSIHFTPFIHFIQLNDRESRKDSFVSIWTDENFYFTLRRYPDTNQHKGSIGKNPPSPLWYRHSD